MKICFDARVILDHQTGLGNYTYNLIKSLLEIDRQNFYVLLIRPQLRKDHPIHLLEQQNLVKKYVNISPVSISQQLLLLFVLLREKPDLYHYPNWDVPLLQPVKSIFTIHDLTYLLVDDAYLKYKRLKKIYTRLNIFLGLKKAKKIITVSESTKKDLLNLFQLSPDKIKVIYEACEDGFNDQKLNSDPKLSDHHGEGGYRYFLWVGEQRPHKNLVRTIQAFSLFKERHKNYKLVVIGKPYASYDEPLQWVQRLNLSDDVIFDGYVDTEKLVRWYKNAEALLFVSLYEGFGLPILEAMKCGTAIITSNISATNEIAGDAAIKVNPYDVNAIFEAMDTIVKNKLLKEGLIQKGYSRIQAFSWRRAAEQTLALYESAYKI